jgi:hypothetical protein
VHTSDVPLEGQITCPAVGANEQIIRCGHGVINRRTSRRSTRIYRHTIDVQPKARPIVDTPRRMMPLSVPDLGTEFRGYIISAACRDIKRKPTAPSIERI